MREFSLSQGVKSIAVQCDEYGKYMLKQGSTVDLTSDEVCRCTRTNTYVGAHVNTYRKHAAHALCTNARVLHGHDARTANGTCGRWESMRDKPIPMLYVQEDADGTLHGCRTTGSLRCGHNVVAVVSWSVTN